MTYVAYFHAHPVKFVHAHHADRPHNRRQHQWSIGMKDDAEIQPVDAVIQAAKQWQDLEAVAEDWELTATYELIPERPGRRVQGGRSPKGCLSSTTSRTSSGRTTSVTRTSSIRAGTSSGFSPHDFPNRGGLYSHFAIFWVGDGNSGIPRWSRANGLPVSRPGPAHHDDGPKGVDTAPLRCAKFPR